MWLKRASVTKLLTDLVLILQLGPMSDFERELFGDFGDSPSAVFKV